ncbi:MAG: endonuclease [Bdellovibrio sp.]|nr:endonuclease [Bdellovibrio sp.]
MTLGCLLIFSFSALADLRSDLSQAVKSVHRPITYKAANEVLFTKLNKTEGVICSVYSPSVCMDFLGVPSPKLMNVEHTWPQSEGANGDAKSDLHHLFATTSSTNSMRSSLPFCDVQIVKWEADQSKRGYNEYSEHCFEPPQNHKGNVARALFYFAIRYDKSIDEHQEKVLRRWHVMDSVDQDELDRNHLIEKYQNNLNPFIEHPELVEQIDNF